MMTWRPFFYGLDNLPGDVPRLDLVQKVIAWWQEMGQKIQNDPAGTLRDTVINIGAAILLGLVVAGLAFLWRRLQPTFWRGVAWLGTKRGLGRLGIRAYLRHVRERYGRVTNIYLDQAETLDLQQVFVPLSLRARDGAPLTLPRSTPDILTDPAQRRLIILGGPGSGKSTLLRALASGVSQQQWVAFRDLVPIFVPLRTYPRTPSPTTFDT